MVKKEKREWLESSSFWQAKPKKTTAKKEFFEDFNTKN